MTFQLPGDLDPGARDYFADEQAIRDRFWHPQEGEVVIDVGSALGSYTLPALAAGATVIAVEPDQAAFAKLTDIATLNGFTDYTHVKAALFDGGPYPEDMWAQLRDSVYHYLIPPRGTPFTTLDRIALDRGLARVDWIKIDVEGAELGVIMGGIGVLERYQPKILIEDHTGIYPFVAQICSRENIRDLLDSLGYVIENATYGPPYRDYMFCKHREG